MSFFEDYRKVIYGVRQTLRLNSNGVNDAVYKTRAIPAVAADPDHFRVGVAAIPAPPDGKITLTKCSWVMPYVLPSLGSRETLNDQILNKVKIPVEYRGMRCEYLDVPQATSFTWRIAAQSGSERPRWMLIGFQVDRAGSQLTNPAVFDHCNLKKIGVEINSDKYPYFDISTNFAEYRVNDLFDSAVDFKRGYHGIGELESSLGFSVSEFVRLYPISVIDLRYQNEVIKTSVQDIVIRAEFRENPPANTRAYAVLVSDRKFFLQSDGNKFTKSY
jgi:hypothetical protein